MNVLSADQERALALATLINPQCFLSYSRQLILHVKTPQCTCSEIEHLMQEPQEFYSKRELVESKDNKGEGKRERKINHKEIASIDQVNLYINSCVFCKISSRIMLQFFEIVQITITHVCVYVCVPTHTQTNIYLTVQQRLLKQYLSRNNSILNYIFYFSQYRFYNSISLFLQVTCYIKEKNTFTSLSIIIRGVFSVIKLYLVIYNLKNESNLIGPT